MAAVLVSFAVVLLVAAGCGMALIRAIRAESDSLTEQFVMGAALGLGLLAYAILAIGLLGILRPAALLTLVVIAGAVGGRSLVRWAKSLIQRPKAKARLDPVATALLGYCFLIAVTTLIGALAPPNGDDWDSLAYHLAAPKIYLAHARIAFIPYDSHTDFPFTMEMLYTLGLAFGGATGAKLFHWGAGWLTALGIAAFCRRLFPITGRSSFMPLWAPPLAAALFLSIPQVQWESTTAYIDLGTALFQFLALVAFVYALTDKGRFTTETQRHEERLTEQTPNQEGASSSFEEKLPCDPTRSVASSVSPCLRGQSAGTRGWLIVSGLMSGWAMGTKMTAMIPFAMLFIAAVVWAIRSHEAAPGSTLSPSSPHPLPPSQRWLALALFAHAAVLVASPWYLKSYLWTNNPVYPFFYRLFPHSVGWTRLADDAYRHEQHFFGFGMRLRDLLMAPWYLAMQGWAFFTVPSRQAPVGTLAYFDGLRRGGMSASFLGLVPLAVFARRWDRRLTALIIYSLLLLLPWFVLSQQSRYLLPIAAPLAVAAAAVVPNLEWDLSRWAAGAFAALVLLLHVSWGWTEIVRREAPVVFGQESADQYLRRTFTPYEAFQFINNLPANTRVAMYQELRGFYLDRDYLWANPLQNTLIPYDSFTRGAELARFLRRQLGVTHVLVNDRLVNGSENDEWYRLLQDAIKTDALVPVFRSNGVSVYAVAP
jgi:4-amino-4-deoxy-L-arabinose transferase-like glycosyltransferase